MKTNLKWIVTLVLVTGIYSLVNGQHFPNTQYDRNANEVKMRVRKSVGGKETSFDSVFVLNENMNLEDLEKRFGIELRMDEKNLPSPPDFDSIRFLMAFPEMPELPELPEFAEINIEFGRIEKLSNELSIRVQELASMDSMIQKLDISGSKIIFRGTEITNIEGVIDSNITMEVFDKNHPEYTRIIQELGELGTNLDANENTIIIMMETNIETKKCGKKAADRLDMEVSVEQLVIDNTEKVEDLEKSSVNNPLAMEKVEIYPNPGNGRFTLNFELANQGHTDISVYSTDGKKVYQESLPEFKGKYTGEIDITGNAAGMYYVYVVQGKKSFLKKIILE